MDLFKNQPLNSLPGTPLAERMRPQQLSDVIGQEKIVHQLQKFVTKKFLPNLIFWGPPGTGKTTLAQILSTQMNMSFHSLNATSAGVKELRELCERCQRHRWEQHQQSILFVDEIHRFNKGQQDVMLPFLEKGEMTLIGATTENPSYELNQALISRCRILVFERMSTEDLGRILQKAAATLQISIPDLAEDSALSWILEWANGDTRKALTALEALNIEREPHEPPFKLTDAQNILGKVFLRHDKASDQHYDLVSAMIKSIRGSDANAGLYYLARLIEGGEDPVFLARRLVILASEDIGNADPRALTLAMSGAQAVELIGLPEAGINLSQVVIYLAQAPKSNSSYLALKKALIYVQETGDLPVPLRLRSAQTQAMKSLGYGADYKYPHDFPKHFVEQEYMPEKLPAPADFVLLSDSGFEKTMKEYELWLRQKTR